MPGSREPVSADYAATDSLPERSVAAASRESCALAACGSSAASSISSSISPPGASSSVTARNCRCKRDSSARCCSRRSQVPSLRHMTSKIRRASSGTRSSGTWNQAPARAVGRLDRERDRRDHAAGQPHRARLGCRAGRPRRARRRQGATQSRPRRGRRPHPGAALHPPQGAQRARPPTSVTARRSSDRSSAPTSATASSSTTRPCSRLRGARARVTEPPWRARAGPHRRRRRAPGPAGGARTARCDIYAPAK